MCCGVSYIYRGLHRSRNQGKIESETCNQSGQCLIWCSYQLLTTKLEMDYCHVKKDNLRLKDGFTSLCSINERLKKQV